MGHRMWNVASAILALALYVPLGFQITSGVTKENLATWLLWAALDGIAAGSMIVQKGNWFLTVAYTFGSLVTSAFILNSGHFDWTWVETFTVALVILCLVIWYYSGAKMATIASSIAVVIAGIPRIIDGYHKPEEIPALIYLGYFVASTLSFIGGKSWTIKERFYPVCAGGLSLLFAILGLRK